MAATFQLYHMMIGCFSAETAAIIFTAYIFNLFIHYLYTFMHLYTRFLLSYKEIYLYFGFLKEG